MLDTIIALFIKPKLNLDWIEQPTSAQEYPVDAKGYNGTLPELGNHTPSDIIKPTVEVKKKTFTKEEQESARKMWEVTKYKHGGWDK